MRLLVIEDDAELGAVLAQSLGEEGFAVDLVDDGQRGIEAGRRQAYDCILLDVMLPGRDGFEVCRELRGSGVVTPILVLTVRNATVDKVEGLRAGADDYLPKPFSFEELLARVRALIRRSTTYADRSLRYRDLELDPVARVARRGERAVELTPKESALLEYLLRHAGRIVSEREIIENVWGLGFDPQTNVVQVYVHHLRGKIDRGFEPQLLRTVRRRGYLLGEPR
ncbi:MAG: response regulator transcription factor [Deltaproteobacteria bacterium]|nr:response regulator transcription factor [Deltaproteobacteria bacterium]